MMRATPVRCSAPSGPPSRSNALMPARASIRSAVACLKAASVAPVSGLNGRSHSKHATLHCRLDPLGCTVIASLTVVAGKAQRWLFARSQWRPCNRDVAVTGKRNGRIYTDRVSMAVFAFCSAMHNSQPCQRFSASIEAGLGQQLTYAKAHAARTM